jgi:tRNA nucleotidyltransferase/poly(A) polymerase
MPDYIYLLENRLSPHQRDAVRLVRDAARGASITVFLTGGAVRDLTTGSPVRDLDFTVQGNALSLKGALTAAGAHFWGEHTPSQTLFLEFPGNVRAEISTARREEFPKPGKPEYIWDTILEDLRRRDFTVNAMALSLNDMSFGLLMDPLNGVADIEARTLRLVSNYGFLESPVRMLRAARLVHRLQWTIDEKTQIRLQNAKDEGMMQHLSVYDKGYELEEIGHEENPLATLKALEAEGWMKELFPAWTASCADVSGLDQMHEVLTRLQMQGVYPDASTAAMELLTAKMKPNDLTALKKLFVRQGFVKQWERLDKDAQDFAAKLTAKDASSPSATWKLFQTSNPSAVLWLGLTGKGVATQNKYKNFFSVWPEAKSQVPATIMQEMRITPELPEYAELLQEYFYALIDGKLKTEEEIRAFLEPYSPPAPPPPVTVRRGRAAKKSEKKAAAKAENESAENADVDTKGDAEDEPVVKPKKVAKAAKKAEKPAVVAEPAVVPAKAPAKLEKPVVKAAEKPQPKAAPVKAAPLKVVPAKAVVVKKAAAPAKHTAAKPVAKVVAKTAPKKPVKATAKPSSAKSGSVKKVAAKKVVVKKPTAKPAPKPAAKKAVAHKAPVKKTAAKPVKKKH